MSTADVIALIGLCFMCFNLGYKVGRDSNTKITALCPRKQERLFYNTIIQDNRLSVASFIYNISFYC